MSVSQFVRVSQHCVSPSSSSGGTKQVGEVRVGCVHTVHSVAQCLSSHMEHQWPVRIKKRVENPIFEIRKEPF